MKDRIKKIIELENLIPSDFADAIGVSRSAINHILNGRNNPSLDIVQKILDKYDNLSSDWLLSGKGEIRKNTKGNSQIEMIIPDLFSQQAATAVEPVKELDKPSQQLQETVERRQAPVIESINNTTIPNNNNSLELKSPAAKKITKIIIMYSDKTYDTLTIEN